MNKPNLFKHATSELSQDAFFCWLFEWAEDDLANENAALQKASKEFFKEIIPIKNKDEFTIRKIKIEKQVPVIVDGKESRNRIDFVVKINDDFLLVFEDKTASTTSKYQLKSYRVYIEKAYSKFKGNIFYYYLKSDIVWNSEKKLVESNGFTVIDLFRIAELMPESIGNAIYDDYVDLTKDRMNTLNNYMLITPADWDTKHWLGFLVKFVSKLGKGSVRSFYLGGSYWYWLSSHSDCYEIGCSISLEFVDRKFAIKTIIGTDKPSLNEETNNLVRKKVKDAFIGYSGTIGNRNAKNTTTIFEFNNYFVLDQNGLLDFDKSYDKILEIKKIFDTIEFK